MIREISDWIGIYDKQIMVVLTLGILISAILIGIKQNEINKKALSLEGHAEIFAYSSNPNIIILQNTGSKSLYLQKYIINGNETKREGSLLPPSSIGYYYVPINPKLSPLDFQVFYKDKDGNNYQTNVTGIYHETFWEIQTKPQKQV